MSSYYFIQAILSVFNPQGNRLKTKLRLEFNITVVLENRIAKTQIFIRESLKCHPF